MGDEESSVAFGAGLYEILELVALNSGLEAGDEVEIYIGPSLRRTAVREGRFPPLSQVSVTHTPRS